MALDQSLFKWNNHVLCTQATVGGVPIISLDISNQRFDEAAF